MQAAIISVGTELMTGACLDTNSAWLSDRLVRQGVVVISHTTIADNRQAMAEAVQRAAEVSDLVVMTGGLGPTLDDLTRESLADVMGVELETDERQVERIQAFFDGVGREMKPSNRRQALTPAGAKSLDNDWGTAPGVEASIGGAVVFAFPGVPREMKAMFEQYVVPWVAKHAVDGGDAAAGATVLRVLRTFGDGESNVAERIADLMEAGRNPAVGTTASEGIISVRIVSQGASPEEAQAGADQDAAVVRERLGGLVYGEEEDTLASVVGGLLQRAGETVGVAESCTGGLLGASLTEVAGSSAYFKGGAITYANEVKQEVLGVEAGLLEQHGAVSEPVARAMAAGCAHMLKVDFALSITGVAGPDGGTEEKPVGTVFIGLAGPDGDVAVRACRFGTHLSREAVRDRSVKTALNMLRLVLQG